MSENEIVKLPSNTYACAGVFPHMIAFLNVELPDSLQKPPKSSPELVLPWTVQFVTKADPRFAIAE